MVNFDLEARIDTATLFKHLEHRLKGFSPDTIGPANNSCRVKGTPADVDANSGKIAISYDGSSGKAYFPEYSRQLQTPLGKKKGLVLASLDVALVPEHVAPCVFEVNIPVYLHLIHFTTGHAARAHICRIANDGEVLSCADLGRVTSNWHDVLERAVEV